MLLCKAEDEGRLINALTSLGICSTPKESKLITLLLLLLFCTYKATQWVPISEYSSRFIIYAPSFILDRLSLE